MRIRSIKPEFWRSDDIDAMSWDDRLVFIGLWSYVDDNGVGLDKLSAITSDLFGHDLSRDPKETLNRVSTALNRFARSGHITRYSVAGKNFLHVTTWDDHQRVNNPNKPRYPLPTCENVDPQQTLVTPDGDTPEDLPPGAVEQRNRGTEEQGLKTPSPRAASEHARFADFYRAYPRKMARPRAAKAFTKAVKRAQPDVIIEGAARYAADPNLPDRQFLPYPEKWLNGDGWNNEQCPPPPIDRRPAKPTTIEKAADIFAMSRDLQHQADARNGSANSHAHPLEITK